MYDIFFVQLLIEQLGKQTTNRVGIEEKKSRQLIFIFYIFIAYF